MFSANYYTNKNLLDDYFRVNENYDVVNTEFLTVGRRAKLYYIDGFVDSEVFSHVMDYLMKMRCAADKNLTAEQFAELMIPYMEIELCEDIEKTAKVVYSGAVALTVDGFPVCFLIKTRSYPKRSVEEPDNDKVLRGAHDGFVESLLINTALIRRRIRDRELTMELHSVGAKSKTDIVLCYLADKADKKLVKNLRQKIDSIDVNSLNMSYESVVECLLKKQYLNPFPKVRYTERPDAAAACVCEGSVILLIDNSSAAMIVPTSFFEFFQDTNDYYFPPLIGTYLRMVRGLVFGLALFLSPVWFLLVSNPQWVPDWLSFITVKESYSVPIFVQLIVIEIVIDALKLASLNTPNSLSNSFSMIGALVLSDLAVQAGLFSAETVLFMAFAAIANFAQPSFELSYAFKISRIFILILTAIFNLWGFIVGIVIVLLTIAFTKTVSGRSYLYPLIPFDGKALSRLLIRHPISKDNT